MRRELDFVEIHLTHHCNLNCASCTHYAPLVTEPWFKDYNEYVKEIAQIAALTGRSIKTLRLLGGEPFLHPDLLKFCFISRKALPSTAIQVFTNGTLLMHQSDEFFKCLNEWNICIALSDYYLSPEIKEFLQEKSTLFSINPPANFIKPALNLHQNNTKEYNFYDCTTRFTYPCYNLRDGYLYHCPTMAYFDFFLKYYKIKLDEFDEFDVRKFGINIFESTKEDIDKYLNTPNEFCKYCDMENKFTPVGYSLSKRNMSEWVG